MLPHHSHSHARTQTHTQMHAHTHARKCTESVSLLKRRGLEQTRSIMRRQIKEEKEANASALQIICRLLMRVKKRYSTKGSNKSRPPPSPAPKWEAERRVFEREGEAGLGASQPLFWNPSELKVRCGISRLRQRLS